MPLADDVFLDVLSWYDFDEPTGAARVDRGPAKRNRPPNTLSREIAPPGCEPRLAASTLDAADPTGATYLGIGLGKNLFLAPDATLLAARNDPLARPFSLVCCMAMTGRLGRSYWCSRGGLASKCTFLGKIEAKTGPNRWFFTVHYFSGAIARTLSLTVPEADLPLNRWFVASIAFDYRETSGILGEVSLSVVVPRLGGTHLVFRAVDGASPPADYQRPDDAMVIGARGNNEHFRGVFGATVFSRCKPSIELLQQLLPLAPRTFDECRWLGLIADSEPAPLTIDLLYPTSDGLPWERLPDEGVDSALEASEALPDTDKSAAGASAGLYWFRPYFIGDADPDLAAARGEWVWFWSSDHGGYMGDARKAIRMGFSRSPLVSPLTENGVLLYATTADGRDIQAETPYLVHVAEDLATTGRPWRLYCHRLKNPRDSALTSGSQLQQETILYSAASLLGPWTFDGIAIPVCQSVVPRESNYDNFHTGYATVYRPGELAPDRWLAFSAGASGTQLGAVVSESSDGRTFNIDPGDPDLDIFGPFLRCEEHNWNNNIVRVGDRFFGVGRATLSPNAAAVADSLPRPGSVSVTELCGWTGDLRTSFKPIRGRTWHLLDGNFLPGAIGYGRFPGPGYIQDVRAFVAPDGSLLVYVLHDYIKEHGSDWVRLLRYPPVSS